MFNIEFGENGEILCSGRLDAAQTAKAEAFLDAVGRLNDDPAATVYGDVEWQGDGQFGDFKVVPAPEDDDDKVTQMVASMVCTEEAEA